MNENTNIKQLTDAYCEHFNRFQEYIVAKENYLEPVEPPNYLNEVIRPVLNALVDLLPEYRFKPIGEKNIRLGDYYRIKGGVTTTGGFAIDENFGLIFTPLFHAQPSGEGVLITDMKQLVDIIRHEYEKRGIKPLGRKCIERRKRIAKESNNADDAVATEAESFERINKEDEL